MQIDAHSKVVAERLGHATPGITLRSFNHVAQGLQREAAGRFDTRLYENAAEVARKLDGAGTT